MRIFEPLLHRIQNPRLVLLDILTPILPYFGDKLYLKIVYFVIFGERLSLRNPKTFNAKLQYLKIYQRDPLLTKLVDKQDVKEYIDSIGVVKTIPTLCCWENAEDIDFNGLPNKFVLKTTHDSGGVIVCNDKSKLNEDDIRKTFKKRLSHNFYITGREWPYKYVNPRVIAEEYLEDDSGELRDYKFFCFDGVVRFFKVDFNRSIEHHANYYDTNLQLISIGEKICPPVPSYHIAFPDNIGEMMAIAERLSKGFLFVRVDLYNVGKVVYFGEMTFYPSSGFGPFTDDKWDYIIGSYLKLPSQDEIK